MIANAKPAPREHEVPDRNELFLQMLPTIERQARIAFRHLDAEARAEMVQEVVANAFVAYQRLVELGKPELAYPTPLASNGIRQAKAGRKVGSRLNVRDVSSRHCRITKTVDLNGQVVVRSKAADQATPTELVLSGASLSGGPVLLNMNRKYLARALQLGFRQVHVSSPTVPVLCEDAGRQYVWALLNPESAVAPASDAIRIASPQPADAGVRARPRPQKRKAAMPGSSASENGREKSERRSVATDHADEPHDVTGLIDQAQALKASLRDALSKTSELISSLKRQRKQSRIVASTPTSLRQPETIDS